MANGLGGLEGSVLVGLVIEFGGILWTEEVGIFQEGDDGFWPGSG